MEASVNSSNGEFTIDYNTGKVIDVKIMSDADYETKEHFKSIVKFDLKEYKEHYGQLDEGYDILDLGYWDSDKNYYEPESDWREHIAKEIN